MTRDQVQDDALEAYLNCATGWGVLKVGTGVGKSKIAVEAIRKLKPARTLVLVDSTKLRDTGWPDTFEKFKLPKKYRKTTDILCYQSAYRIEGLSYDLVIADELDFGLTEEYSATFTKNRLGLKRVLGLTATLDADKFRMAEKVFGPAPVKFDYSTQQAQKDNILNKTRFVFVKYFLSNNRRSATVGSGNRAFYFSENERYKYLMDQYAKAWQAHVLEGSRKTKAHLDRVIRSRKDFLWNSVSSRWVARQLTWKILKENPDNKVLVFSSYTNQVDQICKYTYHGKNKKDNHSIDMLNRGDIRALGVCKAINRGINLVGVNNLVKETYDGSATSFQQQHGRGTRLNPDDYLSMYILVSCYIDKDGKSQYTQEAEWCLEMTQGFKIENSTEIYVPLDESKMCL